MWPGPHRLFKNSSSGFIGWRIHSLESIPGPHKHLKIWAQEGTGGGWGGGWPPSSNFGSRCVTMWVQKSRIPHFKRIFRGWAARGGCVYSSKSIERSSSILENYSARSSSSFCEIWNTSSSSRFELESEKKASSMPRPRPRSMPRFIDPSFLQQPCIWPSIKWLN